MTSIRIRLAALLCAGMAFLSPAQAQYNATPDYWECANRVGGTWTHGRAPNACDVSNFGPDAFVRGNYGPAIFNDAVNGTPERQRYMQEMYPIAREASDRYLKLRKPDVQAAEIAAFQRGFYALLRQESFWSHYRDAQLSAGQPYVLKMMRGDSGHGHGMMQLDDRYHFVPLKEGKGWNMLQNFSYAIEIYYAAWQDAPAKCLAAETYGTDSYWRARSRSAWSAYNGGPTRVCRWQNAADVNVGKDNGYRDNYDNRLWLVDVANLGTPAAIDVACLMDGGSACPMPVSGPPQPGKLLKLGTSACVMVGNNIECVDDMRDAACLASRTSFDDSQALIIYPAAITGLTRVDHNRHQLCRAAAPGLASLASAIATTGATEVRTSVGGMLSGSLPAGSYQVLDFEVRGASSLNRYYRVRGTSTGGAALDGWIDGGDKTNYASKAKAAAPTGPGALPYPGDWVSVNVTTNLNVRKSPPSGAVVVSVPRGTVMQVKEVFGTASANNLYYRVEIPSSGQEGWIFGGNLYPTSSLASWAIPAAAPANAARHAVCPAGARYDHHSRQCTSASAVFGPFTAAATQACLDSGAGAVCTAARGAVVDGVVLAVPQWTLAVAANASGNGDCPRGAGRSADHRWHCTEVVSRNGVNETDVYGPFSSTQVNACLAANANATFCRSNRWPATAFKALQP